MSARAAYVRIRSPRSVKLHIDCVSDFKEHSARPYLMKLVVNVTTGDVACATLHHAAVTRRQLARTCCSIRMPS